MNIICRSLCSFNHKHFHKRVKLADLNMFSQMTSCFLQNNYSAGGKQAGVKIRSHMCGTLKLAPAGLYVYKHTGRSISRTERGKVNLKQEDDGIL